MEMKPSGFLKLCILNSMKERPMHGYELMKQLAAHGWKPSPGSVYPVLETLKKKKLISLRVEGNKKIYHITSSGKNVLKDIEAHKDHIMQNMKSTAGLISNALGEKEKVDFNRMERFKDHPEIMLPMVRISRKILLCVDKKSNIPKLKKMFSDVEKKVDEMLM